MKRGANREKEHIGQWDASIKTGRKAIVVVHGLIPTDGDKEPVLLKVTDRQGVDPSVLTLELSPDLAALDGTGKADVYYSEVIDNYGQYDTVLVRGRGRDLAFFTIEKDKYRTGAG